jgi:short-subunit dehydrogenase
MTSKGTAAITGASSGIGAAFAQRLAAQGYDLLLVARRGERLADLKQSLSAEYGVAVETWTGDLADAADLARLERRLEDQPVAMLVNNAGAGGLGPTAVTGADAQEALIRLNVIALARLSVAALAGFRKAGTGSLVNIASVIAFAPSAGGASYSGSKAFVLNFTRSLQLEYADSGFRIQAILPGPIRTEFFTSQGLNDSIFPDTAYISAEELVDAGLAGLEMGEEVTVPTLASDAVWSDMESARQSFLGDVLGGKVASRYKAG